MSIWAPHLREAKLISLARKGREPGRPEEKEGAGFPAERRTRQNSGQRLARCTRSSRLLHLETLRPVSSPLLDSDHGPFLLRPLSDPCPDGPGRGAAVLPLARSRDRGSSGAGNPVLADSAPAGEEGKVLGSGRGRKEEGRRSGRKKVDDRFPTLSWKE